MATKKKSAPKKIKDLKLTKKKGTKVKGGSGHSKWIEVTSSQYKP